VRDGVTTRRTKGAICVLRFHYSCHPDRDLKWVETERRKYTSQADWDREQEIIDEAGGGELVFAEILTKYWRKIVIEDPNWRPDYEFKCEGGFDHGKANPAALLRAYHDFDGAIIYAGEYYQPGREIWQHVPVMTQMKDFSRMDPIIADRSIFDAENQQQSQTPGHAAERAKTLSDLYEEGGIENMIPFGGDRSDVSFVRRLHQHWADLENREPTVKIVCPKGMYAEQPVPGLYHWGCPNLLWELMNTRHVKLTAQQLLFRNASEAIVDKDNHARDAMKYHLMSYPEPGVKSVDRRIAERYTAAAKKDPTAAVLQYQQIVAEEQEAEPDPRGVYYGRNLRRRIQEALRKRAQAGDFGWR